MRRLRPPAFGRAIETALGPGTSPGRRRSAIREALAIAQSRSWTDARAGFVWLALGRLSLGHDAEEARDAFDTFNIDLMYALPGQTLDALRADLDVALGYAPPHLSVYHLTMEPNTVFATRPPEGLPDEDTAAQMLDLIVEATGAAGLQRYEVSAFARPGHRCRHNLNYWQFGDYLGIGAGAHGKLSFPHRVLRQVRWREPATYMDRALNGQAVSNEHEVARRDLPFEYVLNALRLREGFALKDFCARTGLPPSALANAATKAHQRGLIDAEGWLEHQRVMPTPRGFDFLSDLQALFLPPSAS